MDKENIIKMLEQIMVYKDHDFHGRNTVIDEHKAERYLKTRQVI
jgi:hypothetical protein